MNRVKSDEPVKPIQTDCDLSQCRIKGHAGQRQFFFCGPALNNNVNKSTQKRSLNEVPAAAGNFFRLFSTFCFRKMQFH